ncbi:MAG: pyrophosphate--fructose-6-phosphate 1-phosphotransferase, partial [Opitutales bacterium]|nr:pyrophosphate--fructose-6-phosphate 1-phosphotransferase [Opitutales bacterium]
SQGALDVHGVYIPEMKLDIAAEVERLRDVLEHYGCVNLFVSEGAGVESIVKELEAQKKEIVRDAFGHIKLDAINPGQWFASEFADKIGAEKKLVQKSGYFARSAKANEHDLQMIRESAALAVQCAQNGKSGVIGYDEEDNNRLACIQFSRIKGGKPFNIHDEEFLTMMREIGQSVS